MSMYFCDASLLVEPFETNDCSVASSVKQSKMFLTGDNEQCMSNGHHSDHKESEHKRNDVNVWPPRAMGLLVSLASSATAPIILLGVRALLVTGPMA